MYSLEEFCKVINGQIIQKGSTSPITAFNIYPLEFFSSDTFIAINSKKYSTCDGGFGNTGNEDSVFGLKGTQNTHEFISKAVSLGTTTIVLDELESEENLAPNVNYILVEDSVQALACIAKDILRNSKVKTIGISGSTGKTTLSRCIFNHLSSKAKVFTLDCIRITYLGLLWSIIHDFNNSYDWIVLEMQTDGQGQLDRICEIAPLDYAFIINVRDSHLERFGTLENLLNEKLSLYRGLSSNGKLIINSDDATLSNWLASQNDSRIISVGHAPTSNIVYSSSDSSNIHTLSVQNNIIHTSQTVETDLYGDKEIFCTVMIYAISFLEFSTNEIELIKQDCLSDCVGRFQVFIGKNNSKIIVDSYNASYLSTIYGINRVSRMEMNKKILVLGSLLELSNKAETIHRELGKILNATNAFDYIIFIGEATLYSMNELRNNEHVIFAHAYSYDRAMQLLKAIPLDSNTVIYFKGSGAMRLELLAMNFI